MKTKLLLLLGIVAMLSIFTLSFTLNSNEDDVQNKVRIAYFPNIGHAIPIVGIENGFFEKKHWKQHCN